MIVMFCTLIIIGLQQKLNQSAELKEILTKLTSIIIMTFLNVLIIFFWSPELLIFHIPVTNFLFSKGTFPILNLLVPGILYTYFLLERIKNAHETKLNANINRNFESYIIILIFALFFPLGFFIRDLLNILDIDFGEGGQVTVYAILIYTIIFVGYNIYSHLVSSIREISDQKYSINNLLILSSSKFARKKNLFVFISYFLGLFSNFALIGVLTAGGIRYNITGPIPVEYIFFCILCSLPLNILLNNMPNLSSVDQSTTYRQ
jgi:hypothetical protein